MDSKRKRMVVEEVENDTASPEVTAPLNEVKEKVEELQDITEDLSEDVAKSEEVQEEISQAVDEVSDSVPPVVHEAPVEEPIQEHSHEYEHGHTHESMHEQVESDLAPEIKNPGGTNPLVVIIPGIFLLGALLGGIYFYQKSTNSLPTPTPTPTSTDEVTVTPVPSTAPLQTADLSKYPINILNGSGTPGEAGKVKTILTGGGFSISGTGNAGSYDFTKTVIKAKADVPAAFLSQLSALLSKTYVLDANQTLATSSADKVQVIVGSTKAK